ncbi:MAG TPA: alpha-amylase family glycosyl hydrolase [Melioribacteraceae bacterium]|nr:alpha-amylase family glycosyl hydrolase [Melioribacteraceae bacterium]
MALLNKLSPKGKSNNKLTTFEFHVSKQSRQKYNFDESFFTFSGNVVFANNSAVRNFTNLFNEKRSDDKKVKVSKIYSAGLLDEIYHFIIREYEDKENPEVFKRATNFLNLQLGEENLRKILFEFNSLFPPVDVYKGKTSIFEFLNSFNGNKPNIETSIEEMIMLFFANFNPANKDIIELFDENYFFNKDLYLKTIKLLEDFFKKEKPFGPDSQDIITMLKTPILNNPDDIEGQLEFIKTKWKVIIEEKFINRILLTYDLKREEVLPPSFMGGAGGGAPTVVPKYKLGDNIDDSVFIGKSLYSYSKESLQDYEEPENFTKDLDWMPRVVILAKNTYVWLDQLSKKYNRKISRLDEIPDSELDQLARWNFTGLWLIGLWERSSASKKIKHIMGNPDAISSAYSLYDYTVAEDLGGEQAYENLNYRAKQRGIRLASDMVPNHTGVFSKWVIEKPDYFVQRKDLPYPNYKFSGPNLSERPDIEIHLEDGYFNKSDAAVVFRRIDKNSGDVRYIYHGNDGTNMPWNDTAQLDMLKHEVRQAVIDQIFAVARKFSIIRFDAAMTLTKKHFSRLWYPQPGRGGDIPTRSDYALTREQFDELFPVEFWREVVDRINNEMPDTLLLAEAFWLLEGYFVRTLGMHRVYNSAFMHMLMKEENDKYRDLITNTLEFEPEILKRYVNFMSNPDEETAIKQFGFDDKYFGVATLMLTLPGLPMFGHGQIEGFTEKYGMEYKRAYYNENPNGYLIERHERELFPLMKKRYLFAHVHNFWFYDFIDENGYINEDVFAYTNMAYGEKALVLYNNRFKDTVGKIYTSTSKLVGSGDNKYLKSITVFDALGINTNENYFYIYKEHISNLYFIKEGKSFFNNGFEVSLNAFKYKIYLDFKEVYDTSGLYKELAIKYSYSGVANLDEAIAELKLAPIHNALSGMYENRFARLFVDTFIEQDTENFEDNAKIIRNKLYYFINKVKENLNLPTKSTCILTEFELTLDAIKEVNKMLSNLELKDKPFYGKQVEKYYLLYNKPHSKENATIFLLWLTIRLLKDLFEETGEINKNNYITKLRLDIPVRYILSRLGRGQVEIYREIALLNLLLEYNEELYFFTEKELASIELKINNNEKDLIHKTKGKFVKQLFADDFIKAYLGVNYYEDIWYYSKENFEELNDWFFTIAIINYQKNFTKLRLNEITIKKTGTVTERKVNLMPQVFYKTGYIRYYIDTISVKSEYKFELLKDLLL